MRARPRAAGSTYPQDCIAQGSAALGGRLPEELPATWRNRPPRAGSNRRARRQRCRARSRGALGLPCRRPGQAPSLVRSIRLLAAVRHSSPRWEPAHPGTPQSGRTASVVPLIGQPRPRSRGWAVAKGSLRAGCPRCRVPVGRWVRGQINPAGMGDRCDPAGSGGGVIRWGYGTDATRQWCGTGPIRREYRTGASPRRDTRRC
jgi:hypothetical protein